MIDKKAAILTCAREIFSQKGYKETNITDITQAAGVATGTFYNYYPSKDKIFMEIYIEENAKLKKEILAKVNLEGTPLDVIRQMMMRNIEGMSANPILREWFNRDIFAKLEKSFREEKGIDSVDFLYDSFIEVVRKWQGSGKVRNDIDAGMVMALFGAFINVEMHKDEVGVQYFPEIMKHLSEFIMMGLMDGPKNG